MATKNDGTNANGATNVEHDALRDAARAVERADGEREEIADALGELIRDAVDLRNAVADGRVSGGHAREQIAELEGIMNGLPAAARRLDRAETDRDDALDTAAAALRTNDIATDRFAPGDRAYDPESDGNEVLVLDTPAVRADEYAIPETGETVADYNAGYPACSPDDPVVEVVFTEALDAALGTGEWSVEEVQEMDANATLEDHVSRYAYPATRLTTEPTDPRGDAR
jgi:hypothetical protein